MGLGVVLANSLGEVLDRVDDPKNFLRKLLPAANEESPSMLTKIDWYADTFFNHLQMKRFLSEWDQLAEVAQTAEEQALVASIKSLAVRCQNDCILHLRFIGD